MEGWRDGGSREEDQGRERRGETRMEGAREGEGGLMEEIHKFQ